MSKPLLQTKNLTSFYGDFQALFGIDFDIGVGEVVSIIGSNGAGKTTLINLMTGVLPVTEGRIVLQGEDISHLAPHQRVSRGMVRTFQINQLFNSLTPLETLTMVVTQHRGEGARWWQPLGHNAAITERAEALLEQFHLTDVMEQRTEHLAYGKRRLLEMAIALACEPRVLLLDEPVAGVPAGERDELLNTVAALPSDVSIVLIEHDMDLVFNFADRITVLVNGAVLTEGTPQEIAHDPQVKAVYLGTSHD